MRNRTPSSRWLALAAAISLLPTCALGQYVKTPPDPPTDVEKFDHNDVGKPTCWLATAANLLAAAGYGVGDPNDAQGRADAIYVQLRERFGAGG